MFLVPSVMVPAWNPSTVEVKAGGVLLGPLGLDSKLKSILDIVKLYLEQNKAEVPR